MPSQTPGRETEQSEEDNPATHSNIRVVGIVECIEREAGLKNMVNETINGNFPNGERKGTPITYKC